MSIVILCDWTMVRAADRPPAVSAALARRLFRGARARRRLGGLLGFGPAHFRGLALQRGGLGRRRLLDPSRRRLVAARGSLAQSVEAGPLDEAEFYPARFQIDARDLHLHRVRQAIAHTGALAAQLVQRVVELEVFAAQF